MLRSTKSPVRWNHRSAMYLAYSLRLSTEKDRYLFAPFQLAEILVAKQHRLSVVLTPYVQGFLERSLQDRAMGGSVLRKRLTHRLIRCPGKCPSVLDEDRPDLLHLIALWLLAACSSKRRSPSQASGSKTSLPLTGRGFGSVAGACIP